MKKRFPVYLENVSMGFTLGGGNFHSGQKLIMIARIGTEGGDAIKHNSIGGR
jgi:hypothetical protein